MSNLRIFGLGSSKEFAEKVNREARDDYFYDAIKGQIQRTLEANDYLLNQHHEERRPDGEAYTTSLTNVRGCDVFVISSIYGDEVESVDEKFMKTAIFINTLRHASAQRITLVAPYLCYMRQDRKTESRAPIATQAIAMMLEAVGVDRLLTMDVHNLGAEQNAFRIPIDNLEARKPLADAIVEDMRKDYRPRKWKVLTPDAGGTGRTKLMQHSLSKRLGEEVGIVYADKTRIDANEVEVTIIGDVTGHHVIAIDDMISTGGTLSECQMAVRKAGGYLWGVAATHGLFVNGAPEKLADIPRIYITDTVAPFRLEGSETMKAVKIVLTAWMFAEAIRRIHLEGGSISKLLDD